MTSLLVISQVQDVAEARISITSKECTDPYRVPLSYNDVLIAIVKLGGIDMAFAMVKSPQETVPSALDAVVRFGNSLRLPELTVY